MPTLSFYYYGLDFIGEIYLTFIIFLIFLSSSYFIFVFSLHKSRNKAAFIIYSV